MKINKIPNDANIHFSYVNIDHKICYYKLCTNYGTVCGLFLYSLLSPLISHPFLTHFSYL